VRSGSGDSLSLMRKEDMVSSDWESHRAVGSAAADLTRLIESGKLTSITVASHRFDEELGRDNRLRDSETLSHIHHVIKNGIVLDPGELTRSSDARRASRGARQPCRSQR